jgi:hypothetical protein
MWQFTHCQTTVKVSKPMFWVHHSIYTNFSTSQYLHQLQYIRVPIPTSVHHRIYTNFSTSQYLHQLQYITVSTPNSDDLNLQQHPYANLISHIIRITKIFYFCASPFFHTPFNAADDKSALVRHWIWCVKWYFAYLYLVILYFCVLFLTLWLVTFFSVAWIYLSLCLK